MASDFERGLTDYLATADELSPDAKKLKRWLDKHPNRPLRRRAMRQLESQAVALAESDETNFDRDFENYNAIDWQRLLEVLGPLIQLIIKWFL